MRSFLHDLRQRAAAFYRGFCRLTEIQFSAPWTTPRSRCG